MRYRLPTRLFTILELYNPSHEVPEVNKVRRSTDLEALVLGKGSSGCFLEGCLRFLGGLTCQPQKKRKNEKGPDQIFTDLEHSELHKIRRSTNSSALIL